jgi:hypothetical protein
MTPTTSDLLALASPFAKNISLRDLVDAALLIPASRLI